MLPFYYVCLPSVMFMVYVPVPLSLTPVALLQNRYCILGTYHPTQKIYLVHDGIRTARGRMNGSFVNDVPVEEPTQ